MGTTITSVCILISLIVLPVASAQDSTQTPKSNTENTMLKIKLTSVVVDDQEKAEKFYTEKLGFTIKHDIPMGEYKWLTLVSPDEPDGTELALEPNANPAAKTFYKAMFEQNIPVAAFTVDDVQKTYEALKAKGVDFTMEPKDVGMAIIAVFNDTCGNLIQIMQEK